MECGATMCDSEAASAPEIFLHHAFIDKIWYDWEKKSSAHKNAFFPTVKENIPETIMRPAELIDLSNKPGHVSIAYEPFKPDEEISKKVEGKKTFMTQDFILQTHSSERISEQILSFLFSLFFFPSFLIPSLNLIYIRL